MDKRVFESSPPSNPVRAATAAHIKVVKQGLAGLLWVITALADLLFPPEPSWSCFFRGHSEAKCPFCPQLKQTISFFQSVLVKNQSAFPFFISIHQCEKRRFPTEGTHPLGKNSTVFNYNCAPSARVYSTVTPYGVNQWAVPLEMSELPTMKTFLTRSSLSTSLPSMTRDGSSDVLPPIQKDQTVLARSRARPHPDLNPCPLFGFSELLFSDSSAQLVPVDYPNLSSDRSECQ
ncbi:hypothetical protein ADUPG1_000454 [Aduncisulcus paluster]|uniref:Uncharacterized protein n=1 Tax=Aduncisulcus paluster TaxID=2918883 RepID=A0ABQ5K862_9EUKA|nr:hypothetical protein ADUPG1_000454 [Aduncisulcus paluster]